MTRAPVDRRAAKFVPIGLAMGGALLFVAGVLVGHRGREHNTGNQAQPTERTTDVNSDPARATNTRELSELFARVGALEKFAAALPAPQPGEAAASSGADKPVPDEAAIQKIRQVVTDGIQSGVWTRERQEELRRELASSPHASMREALLPLFQAVNDGRLKLAPGTPLL